MHFFDQSYIKKLGLFENMFLPFLGLVCSLVNQNKRNTFANNVKKTKNEINSGNSRDDFFWTKGGVNFFFNLSIILVFKNTCK